MEWYRKRGYILPTVEATASFHSPLRAGETIAIETTVVYSGKASFSLEFEASRLNDDELAAEGEVTFVFVDDEFESTPLPDEFRACVRERGDS